ncbi:MAG: putative bifunctional diguanylate cyclase/phosphodiesterase [Woeseiaceae bacterium]
MNPIRSVRFRLFALCVGLLVVMGTANLWLGRINSEHEAQVLQQQEQYRRVSVIYGVQQALTAWRFWQGQMNAARSVENTAAEERARERVKAAVADLDARLAELAVFDSEAVGVVQEAMTELPLRLREGTLALANRKPEAEAHFNEAGRLLSAIDGALSGVARREQAVAEEVQLRARERADIGQRVSIGIIVSSTAFGLLLTFLVIRSIIRPMQSTVIALRQVNAGETSIDLPPVSQDEFGDMAVALRQFRDQAEHLRRLAYHDPLTGIGNRAYLEEQLRQGIDASRNDGTKLALLYLDLDNFRSVNDSLGHSAGDRYLSEAVVRLQRFVPDEALVCRYSGDKFAVLLQGIPDWDNETLQAHLREVATNVLRGMSEPFQLGGDLLPMSVSIGIAVYPADGQNGELLVSSADAAMYLAKRSGRNNAKFASPELTGDARRQLALVTDIRRGLEGGEFEPFYQPVVDVSAGRVVGAEALLRWRHPQRGIVLASEFIPAAEDSGLIHALGERCLIRACEHAAVWGNGGGNPMRVSVNLSARQIEDRTAIGMLERLHANGGAGAKGLDFEITETAILQHVDRAQETLTQIRALGHHLSVDDFGTGYSSMVYLQRFPISRIKIDRSFVSRMENSREAQAIISATIALARSLDLEVVAEGVETPSQARQLQTMGCTLQQGYYFTAALPAAEFEAWCKTQAGRFASAA